MTDRLRWQTRNDRYQAGEVAYLGAYQVGGIRYVGEQWRPWTDLPGIRVREGIMKDSPEEARAVLERVVQRWCRAAGLA